MNYVGPMTPDQLASIVAAGPLGSPGVCAAWMDAAERRCGRPAPGAWLCPRHEAVAVRRAARAGRKAADQRARHIAKAEAARPAREAELARIDARLRVITPTDRGDGAMVNMPLSKRMPSDSRITELARLHSQRQRLLTLMGGAS